MKTPKTIFLCHSSKDKSFVRILASKLKENKVSVWFDEWELKVGDSLNEKISEGIHESAWLAVVLSKNSNGSKWVQKELNAAYMKELEKNQVFILPILIDDCEIPIFLKDKFYADFKKDFENGFKLLVEKVNSESTSSKSLTKDEHIINNIQTNKYIELVDEYIEQDNRIKLDKLFTAIANDLEKKLTNEKFLNIYEHPNSENFKEILIEYEKVVIDIIVMLDELCEYGKNKHSELIDKIILKLINIRKNDKDKYGYVWRHFSNYPLLLIIYSLGLMYIKDNNYNRLKQILFFEITQEYLGKKYKSPLNEGINAYHIFNDVAFTNFSFCQYIPKNSDDDNGSDVKKRLKANNRIFNYLKPIMKDYFLNEDYFDNFFDLYEFFIGLIIMDRRIHEKSEILFAPYGRHYRTYSGSGRFFYLKDTIVHKVINDTRSRQNSVFEVGFFDGSLNRFNNALKEYQSLLSRIYF